MHTIKVRFIPAMKGLFRDIFGTWHIAVGSIALAIAVWFIYVGLMI